MDGDSTSLRQPALWRVLLLAVFVAYTLTDLLLASEQMDGASDDLWPQWTLARLAATGHKSDSYDVATQLAYLKSLGVPPHRTDLFKLSHIKDIGICPYPPTFAFLYAPICRFTFDESALIVYFASIGLALVSAWAINNSTRNRLPGLLAALALPFYPSIQVALHFGHKSPWVLAASSITLAATAAWAFKGTGISAGGLVSAVAIICYPGFHHALQLGQNSVLTLTLWALGWRYLVRRRDLTAGIWWGLLAYKPQWLLAIGWVPLAIGRRRVLFGMAISAGLMALAATILLGPAAWGRWLAQVEALDHIYVYDLDFRENLLFLGCDLRCIMLRFIERREFGRIAGWAAIGLVAIATTVWYRRRRGADPAGQEGAGLLFASGLTVAHLYYYDETVFLLPLLVLWSVRSAMTRWQIVLLIGLTAAYYAADRYMLGWGGAYSGPPVWTLVVVALWILSLTVRSEGSKSWACASTTR